MAIQINKLECFLPGKVFKPEETFPKSGAQVDTEPKMRDRRTREKMRDGREKMRDRRKREKMRDRREKKMENER